MGTSKDWQSYKQDGNTEFKAGKYDAAITAYGKALEICSDAQKDDRCVLLKNRAACYLKLNKNLEAIDDTTKALNISPNDVKALFRRCQAHEALGKLQEAYDDAKKLIQLEPKNTAVQDTLRRLRITAQTKVEKTQSTGGMINEMIETLANPSSDAERTKQAMKNLTIYAHQQAGGDIIFKSKLLAKLVPILSSNSERVICLFKIVHGLCENTYGRSLLVMQVTSLSTLKELMMRYKDEEEVMTAFLSVIVAVLTSLCLHFKEKYQLPPEQSEIYMKIQESLKNVRESLESIPLYRDALAVLVGLLGDKNISAKGRDATIDAFISAIRLHKAVADFILENKGISKLLELASLSCYAKMKVKSQLPVTEMTHVHVSVALSLIYDYISYLDQVRDKFETELGDIVRRMVSSSDKHTNLQGLTALSTVFQASRESGLQIAQKSDTIAKVLIICCMDDPMCKLLGAEALAHAATEKKVCSVISKDGLDILKMLYKQKDLDIQVRGLVALCKVTMKGGGNINEDVMIEGGALKLFDACKKFLARSDRSFDLKKWACEGLAYLTVDAEVKEILVDDKDTLNLLLDLAKSDDNCVTYAVCNALCNLTNSYDKPERNPELEKVAEFAKQPVPKPHDMDSEEHVKGRIDELMANGLVTALVNLKVTSPTSKEMISRVFHAIVEDQNHRGQVVQLGGAKVLLPLTEKGTEKGMDLAAQAIAKIGITSDPRLAFPGQRNMEVVRPLIKLMHFKKDGLQKFESLMALTNLASMNDDVRKRIMKEGGFQAIEACMFEEDDMIRQASTECMCNLVLNESAFNKFKNFEDVTERLKLVVLYCGEEPMELARAAAGCLAILTSDVVICKKVTEFKSVIDVLKCLVTSPETAVRHRGAFIVANMMESDKEVAQFLIADEMFEVLDAVSRLPSPEDEQAKKECKRALAAAKKWELIEES